MLHVVVHEDQWFKDFSICGSVAHLLYNFLLYILVNLIFLLLLDLVEQTLEPFQLLLSLFYHGWVAGTLKYLIHEGVGMAEDNFEFLIEKPNLIYHVRLHLTLYSLWLPLTFN